MTTNQKKRSRGRPRKVAAGFDPAQVPRGIYWHPRGHYWYRSDGEHAKRIAGSDAKLSDLHRLAEEINEPNRSTLGWLLDLFHGSAQFAGYAERTRENFGYLRDAVKAYPAAGGTAKDAKLSAVTRPGIQRMIAKIGQETPTKALHVLQYLRIVFRWALNFGYAPSVWNGVNIAAGVSPPKIKRNVRIPAQDEHTAVIDALKRAGALGRRDGAVAPYLWIVAELGYLCRLRQADMVDLTDADVLKDGLRARRKKGSNETLVEWSPRLRAALSEARRLRMKAWAGVAEPMRPDDRPLLVNERGQRLTRSGLNSAWQRAKRVVGANFGLHAMKHRGVTDTPGTLADKQRASGHKEQRTVGVYNHEVAVVSTPKGV